MNVVEFLASLSKLDIKLWLEGENLRFSAPEGAFTPEIKQKVVSNKAAIVEFLRQAQSVVESPIELADREQPLPVSFGQQRLWILDQLNPRDVTYNMSSALRIEGPLKVDVLEKVFVELVQRHESLRTCFRQEDGEPWQQINPASEWSWQKLDLSGLNAQDQDARVKKLVAEDATTPYDLETGPLFRVQLLSLAQDSHVLIAGMHHIISDAWSMEILVKELSILYLTFSAGMKSPLEAMPLQYVDYSAWQRQQVENGELKKQMDFWQGALEGAPSLLALPTDKPRQELPSNNGALLTKSVPADLAAQANTFCSEQGITPFMFFLGVWQLLLGRYANSDDVVVGAPIAGRSRSEFQELIGFFVNLLLMRARIEPDATVQQYYQSVKEMTLSAFSHQDLPIDQLMEQMQVERQPGYSPLAQAAFQLINIPSAEKDNPFSDAPVTIEPIKSNHVAARMELLLGIAQTGDDFTLSLEYNTDLFNESTAAVMLDQYLFLVQQITHGDTQTSLQQLKLFNQDVLLKQLGCDPQSHELVNLNANQLSMYLDEQANVTTAQNAYGIYADIEKPNMDRLADAIAHVHENAPWLNLTLKESTLAVTDIAYGVIPRTSPAPELQFIEVEDDVLVDDELHQSSLELMHRRYDLHHDHLIRYYLLRQQGRYRLVVACHHILLDGASTHILMQRILSAYDTLMSFEVSSKMSSTALVESNEQTRDKGYIHFADSVAAKSDLQATLDYWRGLASQAEPLTFSVPSESYDERKPTSFNDVVESVSIDADHLNQIKAFCQSNGINLPLYFKAVYGLLLQHYCRADSGFQIYEFFANRYSSAANGHWQDSLGCFYQQYPTVFESELLQHQTHFHHWLQKLKQQRELSRPHRLLSLRAQHDLFARSRVTFMYNFYNFVTEVDVQGKTVVPVMSAPKVDGGVQFIVKQHKDQCELELRYDCGVFAALQFLPRLLHISGQLLSEPGMPISKLCYLMDNEVQSQEHSQELPERSVSQIHNVVTQFERAVERFPQQTAVLYKDHELTYEALNGRVNQLAHYLIENGVEANGRVGICLSRSPEFVISVLAVLKVGAAYIPMDPEYPEERLAHMVEDSGAALVISNSRFSETLKADNAHILLLDQCQQALSQCAAGNPGIAIDGDQQIYVIYTSGSTGRPKGAMVTHRGEANLQDWYIQTLGLNENDKTLLVSALGFDLSQKNLFAPLLVGAAIVIPEMELFDEQELLGLVDQHKVSWINCAPSAFYPLVETAAAGGYTQLQSLRYLVLGGEPINLANLLPWLSSASSQAQLINSYGPTECTDVVAFHIARHNDLHISSDLSSLPIGKAIANMQVHVLTDHLQPVIPGCVGEIGITGVGVGKGYINRQAQNDSVFVDSPFSQGKLYRTGDLGRQLKNGEVEYIGRKDFQIKLRGLRIELGEIEFALKQLPAVEEGLVVVDQERLVAYVKSTNAEVADDWRSQLRRFLPEYMIPSYVIGLESWPLTPNGKIDRNGLPSLDTQVEEQTQFIAPRNQQETQLATIWEQVLQQSPISVMANLFEVGGNSLLATRIVSRVKTQFDVNVSVRDLFLAPTIGEFANTIARAQQTRQIPPITVADHSQPLALSYAQQRLWFLQQLDPNSSAYNMPGAFRLRGDLNTQALLETLIQLVERHGVLRTRIVTTDDQPYQVIDPASSWQAKVVDLTPLDKPARELRVDQHVQSLYEQVFDLEQGPLFQVELLCLDRQEWVLLVNMHHIITDGWSNGILLREIALIYDALSHERVPPLTDLSVQYVDYAQWQRNWLQGELREQQISYWRSALAGVEVLNLPTDYPRRVETSFNGNLIPFEIPANLTRGLNNISSNAGASLYMTTLAAFSVLLSKYSSQTDISVGSPIANRNFQELEPLIGFFVNTIVIRNQVDPEQPFGSLLDQVRENTLSAYAHQDVPFERLVDELVSERDMLHSPLFQVLFSLQNIPMDTDFTLPGVELEPLEMGNIVSKFDLEFSMMEQDGVIKGEVVYRTELFSRDFIQQLVNHYLLLLESVATDPGCQIKQLSLLSPTDRSHLLGLNQTAVNYDQQVTVHQLFEQQVDATPDAIALIHGPQQLSYDELEQEANRFARYLQSQSVVANDVVAVMLPRSPQLMVAVLGVLKAGATYLPVDPSYPEDRILYMLADAQVKLAIGQNALAQSIENQPCKVVGFEAAAQEWSDLSSERLPALGSPESLLYVIYTSGSTGKPKGTGASHRAEVNLQNWYCRQFEMSPSDRVLLVSAVGFDLTQKNLFAPLLSGAALVMPDSHEYDPDELIHLVKQQGITWINCAPNAFYPLVEQAETLADLASLRYVFLGGEPIDIDRLKAWLRSNNTKLVNSYGPTECADIATYHVVDPIDIASHGLGSSNIPIGKAIDNVRLYVVDDNLQLVPRGVPGELCIGGDGVGPGYFNDPAQTAQKFVSDPFMEGDQRIYRTGDLVRYLDDGEIEYLGRIDNQVKIRGFRIEPGEIESLLRELDSISASCVVAWADDSTNSSTNSSTNNSTSNKQLVAYVVSSEPQIDQQALRDYLKTHLPEFMVPAYFVQLEAMPLTPNGKVAKNLLPAPDTTQTEDRPLIAPQTETEKAVLAIWQGVLERDALSVEDDFFAVGGHSLLATQVISRLRKQFKVKLPLRTLFEAPTIRNIAHHLDKALGDEARLQLPEITVADRSQPLPLSFVQQQLWLLDQLDPGTAAYNMPVALRISGDLNVSAFEQAFRSLIQRHEVLRSNFKALEGNPTVVIHDTVDWQLDTVDLRQLDGVEQQQQLDVLSEQMLEAGFDLANDVLLRGKLLLLEDHSVFVGAVHHMVSDGWSLNIMTAELMAFYQSALDGKSIHLPELEFQYVDIAAWQRNWMAGELLQSHLQFWKQQLNNDGQVLHLPTDFPRPKVQTNSGANLSTHLSADLMAELNQMAQEEGVTLFMILMAAYQLLLSKYSGQNHINVGTPVAGRDEVETENVVGLFINTVVVSTELSHGLSFRQLLKKVKETTLNVFAHQALPFEKIVQELKPPRDSSRTPFFQVCLNLLNLPQEMESNSDLVIEPLPQDDNHNHAKYEMNLYASETTDHTMELVMVYNRDLFSENTVSRFMSDFVGLLSNLKQSLDQDIGAAIDGSSTVSFSDPIALAPQVSALDLFVQQANQQAEKTAIRHEGGEISYASLAGDSALLAGALKAKGIEPGDRVAIYAHRSPSLITAILAVLRAGAVFSVLDSAYPVQRLRDINEQLLPKFLLSTTELTPELNQHLVPESVTSSLLGCSSVDELLASDLAQPIDDGPHDVHDPAVIGFTSGSTGTAKGVVSNFASLSHFIHWYGDEFKLTVEDNFSLLSGLSHDPLLRDIFVPLSMGATINIPAADWLLDPQGFVNWIKERQITVLHLTPAMGEVLVSGSSTDEESVVLDRLKLMLFGGDRLATDLAQRASKMAPGCSVVNGYGATETPQVMAYHRWQAVDDDHTQTMDKVATSVGYVPVGKAIDDVQISIVDPKGNGLPPCHVGEIWIRTPYLALGYLDQSQAESGFIVNPVTQSLQTESLQTESLHTESVQDRIYKTGDLGRVNARGEIEFLGRVDDQIKIRGYRIEPREIESAITQSPVGSAAAVVLANDLRNEPCLVAYVVTELSQEEVTQQLRNTLRQQLPEYMVPALYIPIERIPLNANGKVQRRNLPNPAQFWSVKEYVAPRTEMETAIAAIWQSVLKIEQISVDENFFDVGGHSLLAIQIVSRVKERYDVEFTMRRLMEVASIEGMASYVENALWLREAGQSVGDEDADDDDFEELEL